ncbi:MAG: DUF975 family protein [Bacilli bacterium]|nr:DUF975 family protein [Bacilli bacterium]
MYCKECGTKNEKDAKFCSKCGKKLTEESKKETKKETTKAKEETKKTENQTTTNSNIDAGGVRIAIKKEAKKLVNGHLIGATAIYVVITAIISSLLSAKTTVINDAANNVTVSTTSPLAGILTAVISVLFTFGISMVCFKAIKGEKFEFSEVFLKPFENIKFLGYVLLLTVIIAAINFVLVFIPIIGWLALIVGYIYYTPAISTFIILLADPKTNQDISFTDAIKKALEIVKGNRIEYYGVTFSFIGWLLLSILTCGILLIWITPYMELTYVNLYQKWIKEKGFETSETGLSNSAIVGITAGGCGCGCLAIIIFIITCIGLFAGFLSEHTNDPQIKSFIDKYTHNKQINENDLNNDLNDIFNSYNSQYNS